MGRQRFTPEQIVAKLREVDVLVGRGSTAVEACRPVGISEQTLYRWRKEYGGLKVDQARRMKDLERENARLKKLVADLALDKAILQEASKLTFEPLPSPWGDRAGQSSATGIGAADLPCSTTMHYRIHQFWRPPTPAFGRKRASGTWHARHAICRPWQGFSRWIPHGSRTAAMVRSTIVDAAADCPSTFMAPHCGESISTTRSAGFGASLRVITAACATATRLTCRLRDHD